LLHACTRRLAASPRNAGGAALDLLCGAHSTPRACNADFANQCSYDSLTRSCAFGASNDYTLAQLFLCSGTQGAQALQCSLYDGSACSLNPNCTFVDMAAEPATAAGGAAAPASRQACVPSDVASLSPDDMGSWLQVRCLLSLCRNHHVHESVPLSGTQQQRAVALQPAAGWHPPAALLRALQAQLVLGIQALA
jgi:hypothetical protein